MSKFEKNQAGLAAAGRAIMLALKAPAATRAKWMRRFPVGTVITPKPKFATGGERSVGVVVEQDTRDGRLLIAWEKSRGRGGRSNYTNQWHDIAQIQAISKPTRSNDPFFWKDAR